MRAFEFQGPENLGAKSSKMSHNGFSAAAMKPSVMVAVRGDSGGGKGSRRAVVWAMDNLMHEADRLVLVHVMPKIVSIPTPCTLLSFTF